MYNLTPILLTLLTKQETTAVIVGIMREKRRTSGIRDRMIELKIKGETSEKPRFQILCICSVYISCLSDDKISFLHSIKQSIITANRFKRESNKHKFPNQQNNII
ncbi:hypothetical protein T01_2463 [Trichinella spiralis]|uniref:Uncharacterized protein n=1 Tax=Trichinella spiralis TaxID=6334 RepID=A0A0V1AV40_TRISP|nr:hypothetical protein T01_2463 [Trichinella spiralis]